MNNKVLIAILVIVGLFFVFKDDLNPEAAFLTRLAKHEKSFTKTNIEFELMGVHKNELYEFKDGNSYFSKYSASGAEQLINVDGNKLALYAFNAGVSGTLSECKKSNSLYCLNKITNEDIKKKSVKKLKKDPSIAHKCKMYSAKTNTNNDVEICIADSGAIAYLKYKNLDYTTEILETGALSNITKGHGDVVLKLDTVDNKMSVDDTYKIPSNVQLVPISTVRAELARQAAQLQALNKMMGQLRNMGQDTGMRY